MNQKRGIRVALVNLPQVVPELMHIPRVRRAYTETAQVLPNLSLAYLAADLEKKGFEVKYVEAFALRMSVDEITKELAAFNPRAVCYNLITETFLNSLFYIKEISARFPAPVIVGGLHLSLYPSETLMHECIDFGIIGEGWTSLPQLLRALGETKPDLSHIKGLVYKSDGRIATTQKSDSNTLFESVSFPARHLLPNHAYNCVMSKRFPITVMISSYGCPFKCTYCDVGSITYQMRSAEGVVNEMTECRQKHDIREIWFQDETFTLNQKRVLAICEALCSSGLDVIWSVRTRADLVNPEILRAMKKAGCFKIHFGIESADPRVLEKLGRSVSVEKIKAAFAWTKETGISTMAFFMIGNPAEERDAIERSIRLAHELPCDFIQVNKLTPCPPSKLYTQVVKETGRDYWAEYTRGRKESVGEMGNYFSTFTPEELDEWQKRFFRSFYLRPSYIIKRAAKVRSWKELRNLSRAAFSLR